MLINLLIILLIAGAIYYIFTLLPIPQPFKNIVLVIMGLILIIYLIGMLTGHSATPLLYR